MKILSAFFLLLSLCGPVHAVDTLDLPDIGNSTGTFLSPEYERRLGQAFLNSVRKQADIIDDPEVETYVQSIGYRLVAHSDNNTQPFTFFVVNDPQINAFAAPGGIVGINTGTIINSGSESELAGVMAHEIAHVTQHHMARSIEMQQSLTLPMLAAMLGAILIATQNPNAGGAAIAAVQGGMAQAQINFTRGNEEEADRIGIQLLARSGFNPFGMTTFFEKLEKNGRYFAQAPEFLRTHPLTTNRIADAEARAETYPAQKSFDESTTYKYIRAKLLVQSFRNPSEAMKYCEDQLAGVEQVDPDGSLRYAYVQALMAAGKLDRARDYLDVLLKQDPENITFMLASAALEKQRGNFEQALNIYDRAAKLYPDYRPLVLNYANALLQAKRPEAARDLLRKYGKIADPDLTFYDYLTRAEAESGNPVESGMANAEYYFLAGETRVAIERLRFILRQRNPQPDYYQQERIHARLASLEQELQIEKDLKLAQ